jgi:hypothetical protein
VRGWLNKKKSQPPTSALLVEISNVLEYSARLVGSLTLGHHGLTGANNFPNADF